MNIPFSRKVEHKTQDFVGINLGNYFIKGLVLKDNRISNYFIEQKKDLQEVLKKVWQEKKISTDKVKISVKNPSCIVRNFPFIKLEKKKLRDAVFYELARHIPFSPEEVYFDFAALEELSPSEVYLLLTVAKKEFINQILGTFDKQNLKVIEITVDSICLINLFLNMYKDSKKANTCILDIGWSASTLTILKKGIPFLVRDLAFSTKELLSILSNMKGETPQNTEEWLFTLTDYSAFLGFAQDSITNLCKEIKTSFDYFEVNKGESIDKLYLTGGLTHLGAICGSFKEYLGIETEPLNHSQVLPDIFKDNAFELFKSSFSVAFGLCL